MNYINTYKRTWQLPSSSIRVPPVLTDSWGLALEFPIGSWAFVKVQFFCTTCPSKKLADKFLSPYEVIAQPGTHLVTL